MPMDMTRTWNEVIKCLNMIFLQSFTSLFVCLSGILSAPAHKMNNENIFIYIAQKLQEYNEPIIHSRNNKLFINNSFKIKIGSSFLELFVNVKSQQKTILITKSNKM